MRNIIYLCLLSRYDLFVIAMKPHEIQEKLRLTQLAAGRVWYVQPSNATTGEGLKEGLTWLSKNRKR